MDNVEEINLFEIIELDKLLKEYALKDFNLIDFSSGYDDMVYLLFLNHHKNVFTTILKIQRNIFILLLLYPLIGKHSSWAGGSGTICPI